MDVSGCFLGNLCALYSFRRYLSTLKHFRQVTEWREETTHIHNHTPTEVLDLLHPVHRARWSKMATQSRQSCSKCFSCPLFAFRVHSFPRQSPCMLSFSRLSTSSPTPPPFKKKLSSIYHLSLNHFIEVWLTYTKLHIFNVSSWWVTPFGFQDFIQKSLHLQSKCFI